MPSFLSWHWRHCSHQAVAVATPIGHCRHINADNIASPCHCCGAGVIAVLELWKVPWHRLGIVAIAALASSRMLPGLHCHHCCHGTGVLTALASSQTLPWRCLGIIAVAALASLRTLPWRHYCSTGIILDVALGPLGHHRLCGAGVLAAVALALLPLLPSQRWRHCGAGIITDITLAPLGHCPCCGTGIIIDVALALLPPLPLRPWHHRGCCNGAIANIVWAPSPLWRWCCHPCRAYVITWAVLPLQCGRQSPSLGLGPLL